MFEGILILGLIRGGVYALLAVGFSLIFGVARMINLAHTCFYMLAAYAIGRLFLDSINRRDYQFGFIPCAVHITGELSLEHIYW